MGFVYLVCEDERPNLWSSYSQNYILQCKLETCQGNEFTINLSLSHGWTAWVACKKKSSAAHWHALTSIHPSIRPSVHLPLSGEAMLPYLFHIYLPYSQLLSQEQILRCQEKKTTGHKKYLLWQIWQKKVRTAAYLPTYFYGKKPYYFHIHLLAPPG